MKERENLTEGGWLILRHIAWGVVASMSVAGITPDRWLIFPHPIYTSINIHISYISYVMLVISSMLMMLIMQDGLVMFCIF